MTVTAEEKIQISQKGYADVGGTPRTRYWTPDGREKIAIACMRGFNRIEDGKVVESGVRDANLDKGWLPYKPEILKPYCPNCDKWHDTKKEVTECGVKKKAHDTAWEKKAVKMKKDESSDFNKVKEEVTELKSDMADIKNMLLQLLKEKGNG